MKTISFTIPLEPKPQKRDRIGSFGGHGRSYKDSKQKSYENKLAVLLERHRPTEPHTGALELHIKAFLPIPVSKPKKWKTLAIQGFIRPTGRNDTSNIQKNLEDVMNLVFYHDDGQIVTSHTEKWYSENPRWEVKLVLFESEADVFAFSDFPEPETVNEPF